MRISCLLILMGLGSASAAQAQQDTLWLSLQEAITQALTVSPDLDAARSKIEYAEARSSLARSLRFFSEAHVQTAFSAVPGVTNPNNVPVDQLYLDPSVRNDWSDLSPYAETEFEVIQPIYTFGALRNSIAAADYGVEVEYGAVRTEEQHVALRAADLYYSVLLADALVNLTDQATDVVSQAMREIDRLLEDGDPEVDDADKYQVLITEQELHRRIREVAETSAIARAGLNRQLLMDDNTVALPVETALEPVVFVPLPLEEYTVIALRNRPELAQARAGLEARKALEKAARADYYPQLVAGVSVRVTGAANRHRQPSPYVSDGFRRSSVRAGIGFRQVLNFAQTRARVEQAKAQHEEVKHLLTAAEELVLFSVERAWRELFIAEAALSAQDSSLAISKEWLRVETINFDLDLGSTENLIDAVRANLALEALHLESVRRYNMAVMQLLHAVGVLGREEIPGTGSRD